MALSKNVMKVQPSATLAMSAKTKEMIAKGVDVINLSIGEPDFVTPTYIQDAAIAAIRSGKTSFYTPAGGLPELKTAISQRIEAETGVHYDNKQIIATTGAKFALYLIFQVILNPGDEVLLPAPFWVSYAEQVNLAGGRPLAVKTTGAGHKVTVEDLEKEYSPKTQAVVLNSPQNPSGLIYTAAELTAIGNWAVSHDVLLISDEIYSNLVYNGNQFTSVVSLSDAIRKNTLLVTGVSKTYAMTGWRMGYVLGDAAIIKAMTTVASHATGNPTAVSQYATIAALSGEQTDAETMRQAFEKRLNYLFPKIQSLPGFELADKPQGAFYLFPNVKRAVELCGYSTTEDFVNALLEEAYVAVVPGRAFGQPDHIRISYANDLDSLAEAYQRIADFIQTKGNMEA
ncbi:aspartate aminotransferase [Loigolactobacillus coryniformis subsp. coryniformis]|uniref:Aminotransferase n=2 Tax=Loigolactobacillus coryniformis TaxID=1610 RepID=A0A0R1FAE5_9LACO|nr:pyridoxal phosphate-dependent aminotransferase [Loigolactobacillus coryniformis]ATO55544.1 aspartate aminotransferase [Loigolactobacillus coryniformis subsp. coryniformis KCTC 3167 = DSM 20001]KRK18639.1 aspartate tyrosine aromatic aminotransferase [Loigolactobacillus coryniformis subsp. coryniformis KCTC 3167 = DSM 20001]OEH89485.1 aspartate aminotransferase [Loigolactobacillus coryniformis subsp. coryniformis]